MSFVMMVLVFFNSINFSIHPPPLMQLHIRIPRAGHLRYQPPFALPHDSLKEQEFMAVTYPHTYYSCPCTDISKASNQLWTVNEEESQDDSGQTFDPKSPRAKYVLYPLEHLLFCSECHEIRCPRCYFEQALYYFCPNCLLEQPSSAVKSESNR